MTVERDLAKLAKANKDQIDKELHSLLDMMKGNADINEFVKCVLTTRGDSDEYYIGHHLRGFMSTLGCHISTYPESDPSTLAEIRSFVANFFTDDAAFRFETDATDDSEHALFVAVFDCDGGTQSPRAMLDYAKKNMDLARLESAEFEALLAEMWD